MEPKQRVEITIKKSNVRKLRYLESFSIEILDRMIEGLYETFKEGEKENQYTEGL